MRKTKLEKGITLVALIITIVVLLILAVVSIGAIRDSKIIGHSKDASSEYTIAQEKETLQLALSEWQLQRNNPDITTDFESAIKSVLDNTQVEIKGENDGPLIIVFKGTKNEYELTANGKIKEKSIIGKYGSDSTSGVSDWAYYEFSFEKDSEGRYKGYYGEDKEPSAFTYTINDDNTGTISFGEYDKKNFKLIGTSENKVLLIGDQDEPYYSSAYTTNGTNGLTKLENGYKRKFSIEMTEDGFTGEAEIDGDAKTLKITGQWSDGEEFSETMGWIDSFIIGNFLYCQDGTENVYYLFAEICDNSAVVPIGR